MEFLRSLDHSLYRLANGSFHGPELDAVMLFWSSRWPWFTVGAAFCIFAFCSRRRDLIRVAITLALVIGGADLVTYQVLKPSFSRSRPCHVMKDIRLVTPSCGGDWGFPSNHAANGMAATIVILSIIPRPRWRYAAFAVPLLVGFSRVYLGVHYPFDVLGGFLVGGTLGAAGFAYLKDRPTSRRPG